MTDFYLRPAQIDDVPVIFDLIKALAEYEKLSHAVTGNVKALEKDLFGDRPRAEVILAECSSRVAGFALFFPSYSTFLTKSGIYLEDLFVLPEYRRCGIGKAFFYYLARLAAERNLGRVEWSVLDWNESAIDFYSRMGASLLPEWRICRLTGDSLEKLASSATAISIKVD
jgi:GNAT superfamily N-acetyltransferase